MNVEIIGLCSINLTHISAFNYYSVDIGIIGILGSINFKHISGLDYYSVDSGLVSQWGSTIMSPFGLGCQNFAMDA